MDSRIASHFAALTDDETPTNTTPILITQSEFVIRTPLMVSPELGYLGASKKIGK
ncbi:hypothetical protein Sjap_015219 [Stephania japonica]|uniref:Uncharacterized protein n=1 Tax=Stephania japonica TaxID=461633 RepID=A0AAP0NQM1_9MAGN